jgi:serine/threonine protein kinase
MKRRLSKGNGRPDATGAMPIPGRMKINLGNKRHHYAPPSPQVNFGFVPGPALKASSASSGSGGSSHGNGSLLSNSFREPTPTTGSFAPGTTPIQTSPMRFMERRTNGKGGTGPSKNIASMRNGRNGGRVGLSDFERIRVLGKGAFGKVLLVRNKLTKKVYAMKILKKHHVINKRQVAHTMSERNVLGHTQHPFVVGMHYAFQTVDKLIFVLDYCAGGDLYYHISRGGRLSEERCKFYAAELAEALAHLHAHGVVYRDLKPENVMMDDEGHVKLVDFGLSKQNVRSAVEGASSYCGTPEYLAPEVMTDPANRSYGTAIDWWSLGALVYEMLTGLPPWYSRDRETLFNGIKHGELTFPAAVSENAREILRAFLCRNPLKRLGVQGGIDQIRKHQFFAGLDWKKLVARELTPPWLPSSKAEDVEQMSTLYFDKVFTRLPVQSEAHGSHQQDTDSTMAESEDGMFNGFSYVSRKMTHGKSFSAGSSGSNGSPKMGTKPSPSCSPPIFPSSSPPRDAFGNNLNVLTHENHSSSQSNGGSQGFKVGSNTGSYNPNAMPWAPSFSATSENASGVASALSKLPEGQKSLSSLASAWEVPVEEDNRRGSDEMFDLDDMSL